MWVAHTVARSARGHVNRPGLLPFSRLWRTVPTGDAGQFHLEAVSPTETGSRETGAPSRKPRPMSSSVRRYLQSFGPAAVLGSANLFFALKLRSRTTSHISTPALAVLEWLPMAGLALAPSLAFFSRHLALAVRGGTHSKLPALQRIPGHDALRAVRPFRLPSLFRLRPTLPRGL